MKIFLKCVKHFKIIKDIKYYKTLSWWLRVNIIKPLIHDFISNLIFFCILP